MASDHERARKWFRFQEHQLCNLSGKIGYQAKRHAKRLAKSLRKLVAKEGEGRGVSVGVYQCGHCHLWHVGRLYHCKHGGGR